MVDREEKLELVSSDTTKNIKTTARVAKVSLSLRLIGGVCVRLAGTTLSML